MKSEIPIYKWDFPNKKGGGGPALMVNPALYERMKSTHSFEMIHCCSLSLPFCGISFFRLCIVFFFLEGGGYVCLADLHSFRTYGFHSVFHNKPKTIFQVFRMFALCNCLLFTLWSLSEIFIALLIDKRCNFSILQQIVVLCVVTIRRGLLYI